MSTRSIPHATSPPATPAVRPAGRLPPTVVFPLLSVLFAGTLLLALGVGSIAIPPHVVLAVVVERLGIESGITVTPQQASIIWSIRLPRVLLGALVGSGLALAGALLQGIFRNPLAAPGLIGVSSGAALGAVAVIVLGFAPLGLFTLPLVAFCGGALATLIVYQLAQRGGHTSIASMLLVGIAFNALAGAATGVLTYLADDPELRSVVFWTMGGLGGALWESVLGVLPFTLLALALAPILGRALNLFTLGEVEAYHLGINIERTKQLVVLVAALATGAGVAVAGPIGFIGLVVPHLVRLTAGPDHRTLLPASALGGATLLLLADLVARTIAAPAEVPVGLITAFAGGPFFLYLILRTRQLYTLG